MWNNSTRLEISSISTSVRAPQYMPDMMVNVKIPKGIVHKLPFKSFRIWPLALWPYPEHCKDLAFFRIFL